MKITPELSDLSAIGLSITGLKCLFFWPL